MRFRLRVDSSPRGVSILCLGLLASGPAPAAAQKADAPAATEPALVDLPLASRPDSTCALTRFAAAGPPDAADAEALLAAILRTPASSIKHKGAYYWIVYTPVQREAGGGGSQQCQLELDTFTGELASVVYDAARRKVIGGDKLYEADSLRVLVILAERGDSSSGRESALEYAVRAGAAVERDERLVARGARTWLALLFGEILPSRGEERGDLWLREEIISSLPYPIYEVGGLTVPVPFPDATARARIEVDFLPTLDEARPRELRESFLARRAEIESDNLGYDAIGAVFDSVEKALSRKACRSGTAAECLLELRKAAIRGVPAKGLTAQHAIVAVREAAASLLAMLEEQLTARTLAVPRTFEVVTRTRLGFSAGLGYAVDDEHEIEYTVDGDEIVAESAESEPPMGLALVDLYWWPVDTGEAAATLEPHFSFGLSIGEHFRPAGLVGLTIPHLPGRPALAGGVLLRRETSLAAGVRVGEQDRAGGDDSGAAGDDLEPVPLEDRIEEDFGLLPVFSLKVGLPF